jgi:hypothetical protein
MHRALALFNLQQRRQGCQNPAFLPYAPSLICPPFLPADFTGKQNSYNQAGNNACCPKRFNCIGFSANVKKTA